MIEGLTKTRAALAEYDERLALLDRELDRELERAASNEAVEAWQRARESAVAAVQDAFYEDCVAKDIPNSRDHCRIVSISQLREWAG